jgi:AbrB family looped-hinge helix DNA binding protein
MLARVRDKGQVTIPASIREALGLEKDSMLSVARVGDAVVFAPKATVFDAVSAKFSKEAKNQGITLDALLKDLKRKRRANSL